MKLRIKNLETSLVVFMPNITRDHSITYTNIIKFCWRHELQTCIHVLDEKNANIQKLIIKDKIFKCNLTCTCDNNIIKSYYKCIWYGTAPLLVGLILTQTSLLPLARTPSSRLARSESLNKTTTKYSYC